MKEKINTGNSIALMSLRYAMLTKIVAWLVIFTFTITTATYGYDRRDTTHLRSMYGPENRFVIDTVRGRFSSSNILPEAKAPQEDNSTTLLSIDPLVMAAASFLSWLKNFVVAHPVTSVTTIGICLAIGLFFTIWRVFFPVKWYIWRLKSDNYWVRFSATRALGNIKDPKAIEPLIKALGDKDSDVRKAAAEALGNIKDPKAVEPLIKALGDKDSDVRKAAAKALGELKDTQAVQPLIKALGDEYSNVREAAAKALGELKDTQAVQPLIKALGDEDWRVHGAARDSLVKIGQPAIQPLIKALGDKDWRVRGAAAGALGKLKDTQAVQPLIKALGDEEWWVRQFAIEALGNIKDPKAIEPLIKVLLGDEHSGVRYSAAIALDSLNWKPQNQREIIFYLIAKQDWQELIKIGLPAVEPLIKALGDKDSDVRQAAAKALDEINDPRLSFMKDYIETMASHNSTYYIPLTPDDIKYILACLDKGIAVKARYIPYVVHEEEYEQGDPYGESWGTYTHMVLDSPARIEITLSDKEEQGEAAIPVEIKVEKKELLAPQFAPDVPFWNLEVGPFDTSKEGMVVLDLSRIISILDKRSWMWNHLSDSNSKQEKVIEKIKYVQSKTPAIIATLYENSIISRETPLISIYLMGSYPWVESPNDIDLVVVLEGDHEFSRISSSELTAGSKEIIPNLKTSFEVVGLEMLKKAAKGKDIGMAKVIRRKLIVYSGAIPLAGVDIFRSSLPPLENFRIMHDDLLSDAKLAKWKDIEGDSKKIAAKRRWREEEAQALKRWIDSQSQQLDNIGTSIIQELEQRKEISLQDLFTLIQSRIPESMQNLRSALEELKPLSEQESVTADTISKAIAEAKERHNLSEEETRILWLALTGPGQGLGEIREKEPIPITQFQAQEILTKDASMLLKLKEIYLGLPAELVENRHFKISIDKDWMEKYPEQYMMLEEWWKALGEIFKGYATFKEEIVPTVNGRNGLIKITCEGIGHCSITVEGNLDIGPRLFKVLNMTFAASSIPDIKDGEGISDFEPLIRFINGQYYELTGARNYIDMSLYNQATIQNKIRTLTIKLPPIKREDYDRKIELETAIEALKSV